MQGKTIADRAGATLWGGWVVWWTGQAPSVPSGRQWQGSQSSQGASELGFPRPALWQMQSEAAGRAGEPSGQGEEAPPEGPGGHHPLVPDRCARSSGPGQVGVRKRNEAHSSGIYRWDGPQVTPAAVVGEPQAKTCRPLGSRLIRSASAYVTRSHR